MLGLSHKLAFLGVVYAALGVYAAVSVPMPVNITVAFL
jgi:hypothetical protein